MKKIEAINHGKRLALLDTGELIPITSYHLHGGREQEHYSVYAMTFVAGPCDEGKWYTSFLSHYCPPETLH